MLSMKRMRFPLEIILVCVRWYAAYAPSHRNLEEMMQERGVCVDHSTISRWAINFSSDLGKIFRKHKRPVIVEQDHRAVKRITKPMLEFKSFWAAKAVLDGIELMHMIRQGQLSAKKG